MTHLLRSQSVRFSLKSHPLLLLLPRSHTHSHTTCCTPSAAPYVCQPVTEVQQVPTPLCRRPPSHVEQLAALLQWRQRLLDQIAAIKNAFVVADGGADAAELQREVTWVLDDVVAAWREQEQQQWAPCTWQQLHMELQAAARHSKSTQGWQVQLRAPVQQLQSLWQLRLQERVPFQYLINTAHWRDLVLAVGPGVLVPRPETELMIDLAAAAVAATPALAGLPWADLGTGSGAIAIGLARLLLRHHPQPHSAADADTSLGSTGGGGQPAAVRVHAVDLSPTAVAYASANAAASGAADAVRVWRGSWFEPLQGELAGRLGGVLSNPPYIPRPEMSALQAEVGRHEPWSALDGGPQQGMDSLQVICAGAADMLAPGGFLALETAGREQAFLVQQLLEQLQHRGSSRAAFRDVVVHDDCFGVPRFVTASKQAGVAHVRKANER